MDSKTPQTDLEQVLLGFALLPSLLRQVEELSRQVAAIHAELAQQQKQGAETAHWLRLKEAAKLLNVSPKTARRYVERKLLRRSSASRHILIPADDVKKLIGKVIL